MSEKLSIGRDRSFPPKIPNSEDYVVDFDGINDPAHPYNWRFSVKYIVFPSVFSIYLLTQKCNQAFYLRLGMQRNIYRVVHQRRVRTRDRPCQPRVRGRI